MTLEFSRNRPTQPTQSVDPHARPDGLAGAESRLEGVSEIRRGIAQNAVNHTRAQDDFHETMTSQGRRSTREQLERRTSEPNATTLSQPVAPLMRAPVEERATQALMKQLELEQQRQKAAEELSATRAAARPVPVAAPQQTEPTWVASAAQETVDAGKGFFRLSWDVGSFFVSKAGQAISAGVRYGQKVITDPVGAVHDVVEAATSVADGVVKAGAWAVEKGKDAVVWVAETGLNALKATGDVLADVGTGIGKGLLATGSAALGFGKVLVGQMSWSQLSHQVSTEFAAAGAHLSKAYAVVSSGVKSVAGFALELSNSIGLTDICVGAWKLSTAGPKFAADLARVAMGQATLGEAFSGLGNNLLGASQCVVGGLKCLGEVTGITDLCMAAKHGFHGLAAYGRGDQAAAQAHLTQAALHGAFAAMSIGTIAATVATAGAAAPTIAAVVTGRTALKVGVKQVLNVAAKEFFKEGAKTVAKQVEKSVAKEALDVLSKEAGGKALIKQFRDTAVEQLGAKASKVEVAELVGRKAMTHLHEGLAREASTSAHKAMHELVQKEGLDTLTTERVKAIHRDATSAAVEKHLERLNVKGHVSDAALELLHSVRDKKVHQAGAELAEKLGVSQKEGVTMAKKARAALMKGSSDDAIKEELTEGISKHLSDILKEDMEHAYKDQSRKILRGELDEPWAKELSESVEKRAKQLGKSKDELVDEFVDAGWEGAKEGIEKAVRKVVREGIDDAFKRFRQIRLRAGLGDVEAAPDLRALEGVKGDEVVKGAAVTEAKLAEEARPSMGDMAATTQYSVTEGNEVVTVTLAFDNRDNRYHEIGRNRASIKRDKEVDPKATAA
jgi:hypothetical protein